MPKHTAESLKKQYKNFKEAKADLGLKARSWKLLAEKLNIPKPEEQIAILEKQLEDLTVENKKLRQQLSCVENGFDEVGFWLLDRNFERANFEDFGISEEITETESAAKSKYRKLARKYHPDNGGLAEQMTNLNKLENQMLSIVKLNGGIGL